MSYYLKKIPLVVVIVLIVYLSLRKPDGNPPPFNNVDKLYHFIAYGALGFSSALFSKSKKTLYLLIVAGLFLGFGLEYVQGQLAYRDMSIADGVANTLGLFSGVFFFNIVINKFRSSKC